MNPITKIRPVSDAEAAQLVRGDTMGALADDIIRSAVPFAGAPAGTGGVARRRSRRSRPRTRLLIGVPVAVGLAVAGLIAVSLGAPGQHLGPLAVGPPKAQAAALEFTRSGGYIRVIVRNPLADPKKYRAEFAKYHLDIGLTLVPASPSIVGMLVAESLSADASQLRPITAHGRCYASGGGVCPVGVLVPVDFRGSATLVFGRAARLGEQYESAGDASAPGEAMHGLLFQGKTVATVLAMLARRGITVATWRVQRSPDCYSDARHSVPGNWLVYDAVPWAPGQVMLSAAKTLPVPACVPSPGSPTASKSPVAPMPSKSPTAG